MVRYSLQYPVTSRFNMIAGGSGATYTWGTLTWGACVNSCPEQTGTQTRPVECYSSSSSGTVPDSFCPASTRPVSSQSCTGECGKNVTFLIFKPNRRFKPIKQCCRHRGCRWWRNCFDWTVHCRSYLLSTPPAKKERGSCGC